MDAIKKWPEPIVGLYVINKDSIVMVKSPKWKGWRVPGGHVEYGEHIFDAAKREAKEELGINVKPLGVIAVAEAIMPKDSNMNKHFIFFEMICTASKKKLKIEKRELSEYRWARLSEAKDLFHSRLSRDVVRKYLRNKKEFISLETA
ncbi:MAG: NUDIX domain-containing protein [Candidatus Micrarchaeota archaeon]|nr:NUDIX domain-containing protein [Candidatus Micrarchaeota archaeon]